MTLCDLDTPSLIVDLDILESNLHRMARYCAQHRLRLRPHVKTHKVPEIAHMQIASGAQGITVAKVSEAEVMADCGIKDILIAYPVLGPLKERRLADLARGARVTIAVDSVEAAACASRAAQAAGSTISLLLDVDVGFGRTGFGNTNTLVEAATRILRLPNICIEGLFCYPGHIQDIPDAQRTALAKVEAILTASKRGLEEIGIAVQTISSGSTPTAFQSHQTPTVNEIRPGIYVFNDANHNAIRGCGLEDCALSLLCTVTSQAVAGQVIVDAGSKALSCDPPSARHTGYGRIIEYPNARITRLSEEHGFVDVRRCEKAPKLGERVRIIPNHVCPAVNLHDAMHAILGEKVETTWRIAARGKLH